MSYPDSSFDRVVSISTIEHVWEIEHAAAEIGRVLCPSGIAVIMVPFSRRRRTVFRDPPAYCGADAAATGHGRVFYEYHLDREMLEESVIKPSALRLKELRFIGEPGFP